MAYTAIRVEFFPLIFRAFLDAFVSYNPSLKPYGLPRMTDHKDLQAVLLLFACRLI